MESVINSNGRQLGELTILAELVLRQYGSNLLNLSGTQVFLCLTYEGDGRIVVLTHGRNGVGKLYFPLLQ